VRSPLIRKQVLEQVSAPDELDRQMHVTGPKTWLALVALCALVLGAVAWGFLGRVPVAVTSEGGILLKRDSIREVVAQEPGVVTEVGVSKGDTVEEGQVVARLQGDGEETVEVKSFFTGTALEVLLQEGIVVDRGDQVAVIERGDEPLQAIMYVPIDDGKRLEEGMLAHVSPSTVASEEFGYIRGTVSRVSEFPPSEAHMMLLFENRDLVESLRGNGGKLEVIVDLAQDTSTPSGFEWSSPQGPPTEIANATHATATFILGEERPAELVLPSVR
jgi:pyruvate/2-oxoglutarate dehydrogenase complex dihydrolipoamide acyltransferase (E2) component